MEDEHFAAPFSIYIHLFFALLLFALLLPLLDAQGIADRWSSKLPSPLLHLCHAVGAVNKPAKPAKPVVKAFPWERLPFELRQQIFDALDKMTWLWREEAPVCYFDWSHTLPPLVIALRRLPISHQHVIKHLDSKNTGKGRYMRVYSAHHLVRLTKTELRIVQATSHEVG